MFKHKLFSSISFLKTSEPPKPEPSYPKPPQPKQPQPPSPKYIPEHVEPPKPWPRPKNP